VGDKERLPGEGSVALVDRLYGEGIERLALITRHSAREFNRDVHDLVNPLTDEGRLLCRRMGEALPKGLHLRGYASPPERCLETAKLIIEAHAARRGTVRAVTVRAVESLGVFYALDQIKMWKALQLAGGLSAFVEQWASGEVAADAMIPAGDAARLILRSTWLRLQSTQEKSSVDLCVTHDMTILLLRDQLLGEPAAMNSVDFLEGLALYERAGSVWLRSTVGKPVDVSSVVA